MNFHLTDAGRAAITDAANRRTNQVVFTRMVVGDGLAQSGVDDSGRGALRNERQRQGLTAVTGGVARIGVRASFTGMMGDMVWNATEVGLIARVGAGPEFLAAYGAVEAGADAYAVVAPGVAAVIAATVDVVASAAAVAVAVTPDLTVSGAAAFSALLDTPPALAAGVYYRGNAAGNALEAVSAADLLIDLRALTRRWGADQDLVTADAGEITLPATLQHPAGWLLYAQARVSVPPTSVGRLRFRVGGVAVQTNEWNNISDRFFVCTLVHAPVAVATGGAVSLSIELDNYTGASFQLHSAATFATSSPA